MDIFLVIIGILIPFIGTSFGAALVMFMRQDLSQNVKRILCGFASGVMIAASIWSLLLPAIELSIQQAIASWIPTSSGFLCGIFFLLLFDHFIYNLHEGVEKSTLKDSKKNNMLIFAVTLHNIPEGMAVGVVFASYLLQKNTISLVDCFVLAIGIALQNIPEGAIISMPLPSKICSKWKAFIIGVASGIVEPIAACCTIFLIHIIYPLLPFLLSFAAGAMMYVVVEELIPQSQQGKHTNLGTLAVAFGFVVMMILDITLG